MSLNTFLETDLFRNLSTEERLLVNRFAATSASELPKFFNASTQSTGEEPETSISREFEAFLILQAIKGPDKLSNAMVWFNEAAILQLRRDDRDKLLEEAFELEKSDALSKLQELVQRTSRFNAFRSQFQIVEIDGEEQASSEFPVDRFSQVPEIGLIMRDSQAAMGEVATKLSRSEFRVVHNEVLDTDRKSRLKTQDSVGGIADERVAEELLSWRDVISKIQATVTGARG